VKSTIANVEKKTLVVPHFHYDVAWIRSEREYLNIVYKILSKVLEIMDRDDDFMYVVDQAYYLEKLKAEKPRIFKRLADRVSEGRIEVVNAGYAMPDLNLVSPLVIKKNYEIMNEFVESEFNVRPKVAWMVDCFGHPGIMPRIVKETGLEYYVFWRGMNLPDSTQEFIWAGTDGTRILTHWMKHSYSLFGYRFKDLKKAVNVSDPSTNLVFIPFGADFYVPDEKLVKQVHEIENAEFVLPTQFFEELEKHREELPRVEGEMLSDYRNFRGYYSSRVRFKKLYRRAEKELLGREASEEEWKNLLYAAFHDIICGTGIDQIYPYAEKKLEKIRIKREAEGKARPYRGKFLERVLFELKAEEGDLYHTIPSIGAKLAPDSVNLESYLKDSGLDLVVRTDFQHPRHVLRMIIKTGIRDGKLTHHLLEDVWVKRELNTLYAFNDFFEYKDEKGDGLRFYSDDCFDYEVKDTGDVYLTLVRSVQILSHGDAGPRIPCPKALELGKHVFKVSLYTIGKARLL
jgi:alpha-mannosidase